MKKTILALLVSACCAAVGVNAQSKPPAAQKIDAEYTAKIKESLQDPRITTELVDHLPASDTVPTPLKFLGRYVGQPGELTYAKDIHRYYEQLAKVSPRARYWKIGTTEEGRDMVALAIADEATIKNAREVPRSARRAERSAQDHRRAGAGAAQDRQADLLPDERHALAGERRPRDADRAGLPADRRGDAVHPEHPQQRDHADHAGDRGGRPREAGRHLLLQQDARPRRRAAAADVLGQVRAARQQPRRHGPVPRADQGRDAHAAAVVPDRHARPARGADLSLLVDRHRPLQRRARSDRRSASGGCSRRTT